MSVQMALLLGTLRSTFLEGSLEVGTSREQGGVQVTDTRQVPHTGCWELKHRREQKVLKTFAANWLPPWTQ